MLKIKDFRKQKDLTSEQQKELEDRLHKASQEGRIPCVTALTIRPTDMHRMGVLEAGEDRNASRAGQTKVGRGPRGAPRRAHRSPE